MAVSFDSWAGLQAAVKAWTAIEVPGERAEEFIGLAEDHFQLSVFTPDREETWTLQAAGPSEPLPADFWGFKSAPFIDGPVDVVLRRVTPDGLRAAHPGAPPGTPRHFAIEGSNLLLGPVPANTVVIRATYWKTIPPLGPGTTSNWLLARHPSLYLCGALAEAFAFHLDEAREGKWLARRDELIAEINRAGSRRSSNSGPLVASRPIGQIRNIRA